MITMIGQILRRRYKIIKQLGAGGIGETYLTEDLDIDIPVTPKPKCVLKRLKPQAIQPDVLRLFETEAITLYNLGQNHDQIPKLFAYFEENNEFYLIQEFIDGQDLGKELSPSGKKLSEAYVIKMLRDVLEVLAFVHQNKVIHRDIKPSNIMRRRRDGKLMLIDFGAVKEVTTMLGNVPGQTSRTVTIGTLGYIDKQGRTIIKFQFSQAQHFSEGVAGVEIGDKYAFINKTGQLVSQMFDGVKYNRSGYFFYFSEGLASVRIGKQWGYIDTTGKVVIEPKFYYADDFHNGRARVYIKNKLLGLFIDKEPRTINRRGEFVD
jgi:serine/threonine protein kinase